MKNLTKNDPFDRDFCLKGLIILMNYMIADMLEYSFYFTAVHPEYKHYQQAFTNSSGNFLPDMDVLGDCSDPYVINSLFVKHHIELSQELYLGEGFDPWFFDIPYYQTEAERFPVYRMNRKKGKSLEKLIEYYESTLQSYLQSLYCYAWAFFINSYDIPFHSVEEYRERGYRMTPQFTFYDKMVELIQLLSFRIGEALEDVQRKYWSQMKLSDHMNPKV